MTLTVHLRRRAALKTLGPVLDAAVARGHAVALWVEAEAKDPLRAGDFARWPGLPRVTRPAGVVVGLATDPVADVGVPQWADNVLAPLAAGARQPGYLSAWHRALHAQCWPGDAAAIARCPIVGWPMADHRALLPPDPGPPCHVLFTMKRRVPEPWRRSLRGRAWYVEQVLGAWHAAKEAGLPLVIKTRRKHGDPWWLRAFGRVIAEPTVYPAVSLQLLHRARRATHFGSGAHAEARLLDVPVLHHAVPMPHLLALPGQAAWYARLLATGLDREAYGEPIWGEWDDTKTGERVLDVAEAWRP